MRALVLAAGLGTRLRPITDTVPKCLVPIHGVPLLDYWLELLFAGGIERVLVNTSYLADAVRAHVGASPWRSGVTLVHEPVLLGTGGTVLANRDFFGGEAFLVAHGDNLTRFDVPAFVARHRARPAGTALTMMTFDTDAPQSCGIVEEDERGIVFAMHEKVVAPPGRRANAAVYIFEPEIIDFLAGLKKPTIDLSTEILPAFMGRICAFHNADYHRDIGTAESLRLAELEFRPSPTGAPATTAGPCRGLRGADHG
ncbi:MAG: nucleotidyltransferase family protein [Stellaceae bacterium]